MAYTNFTNCTKEQYESIIYSEENTNRIRIWFNNVELIDADEYCENFSGTNRILPSDGNKVFTLDNFIAKDYTLILRDLPEETIIEDQVRISIGTLVDETNSIYEDVPIGIFNIQDTPTRDNGKITIKLRDNRVKFDFNYNAQPLIESLGGTATKKQILEDICNQAGVINNVLVFDGQDDEIGIYDNTITATTYVSYIFEQAGLMPIINRNGELDKIYFNDLKVWRIPLSIVENYELGTPFEVQRVVYESGVVKYESSSEESLQTLYLDAGNPYITNEEQIDNIYNMLNCFSIDSVKTGRILGNPAIDPFDILEVYDDEIGDSPITTETGASINLEDTIEKQMKIKLEPSTISQTTTPTLTTPQPVSVTKGEVEFTVISKNVISNSAMTQTPTSSDNWEMGTLNDVTTSSWSDAGLTVTTPASGNANNGRVIKIKNANSIIPAGKTVTFSIDITGSAVFGRIRGFYKGTGQFYWSNNVDIIADTSTNSADTIRYTGTFTMPDVGTLDTAFYIDLSQGNVAVTTRSYKNVMLEFNSEATEYEPYTEQKASINLGKNLCPNNLTNGEASGITYTVNDDGSIHITGTASARVEPDLYNNSSKPILFKAGTYKNTSSRLIVIYANGYYSLSANSTTTLASDIYATKIYFRIESGESNLDETYYPQIIVNGQKETYAKYFTPIEYCAIGTYKDSFIKTTGKNLVDVSQIQLGKKWNNEDSNNHASILYIPVEKNQQYTLTAFWSFSRIGSLCYGYLNNGPEDTTNYERITIDSTSGRAVTFNSGNWSYISISFSSNYAWDENYLKGLNVMLCKGAATVDDYEPYGINRWFIKKRVDSITIDGTETADSPTSPTNSYRVYFYNLPIRFSNMASGIGLSNYFLNQNPTSYENCFRSSTSYLLIRFNTSFETLDSIRTWLSEHKPIFYGRLYNYYYYSIPESLEQELEIAYKTLKSYNGQTNIIQNNIDLPFQITATAYNNSLIFSTLANNTYTYNGVNRNQFDTQIGLEQRTENVSISSEATLKKWAKTNIDNLQGQITLSAGDINDLEGRVNQTELDISSQGAKIDVLSTNIDEETGNVLGVKTTSYELGSNGFIIDDGTGYKSIDNTTGKYFYDNNSMVGKYTKDGSVQKNLALFGKYYYGVDENVNVETFSKEEAMFVAQEYTGQDMQGNDETGFGHFYNGD